MEQELDENQKNERRLKARERMMDHIARRDHSESELRQKLKDKFEPEDIDAALAYGKEKGWIPGDETSQADLAHKTAEMLHRKLKGIHFINQYLAEKGLPNVIANSEHELEKARELLATRYPNLEEAEPTLCEKAGRFLVARGYDQDLVRELVFKNRI